MQLRRAYQLMDQGDEHLTAHEFDKAASVIAEGLNLAPEITELKFWAAVSLLKRTNLGRSRATTRYAWIIGR